MVKQSEKNRILKIINDDTCYDADSVIIHRDGRISALRDGGTMRLLVCFVRDFSGDRNPFST